MAKKKIKILCDKCNEIATSFFRRQFFDLHKGTNRLSGCGYKVFLRRLKKLIFETTGNVNTAMYIDGMIEYIDKLEKKQKKR